MDAERMRQGRSLNITPVIQKETCNNRQSLAKALVFGKGKYRTGAIDPTYVIVLLSDCVLHRSVTSTVSLSSIGLQKGPEGRHVTVNERELGRLAARTAIVTERQRRRVLEGESLIGGRKEAAALRVDRRIRARVTVSQREVE